MRIPKRNERDYELYRKKKLRSRLIRQTDDGCMVKALVMKTRGRGAARRFTGFYEDTAAIRVLGKAYAVVKLSTKKRPIKTDCRKGFILVEDEL